MTTRDSGLGAEMFAMRPRGTALTMQAGSSLPWSIEIVRAEGFDVPILLEVFGAPRGVRIDPVLAGPEHDVVELVLVAAEGSAREDTPFSLQASADGWVRRARITVRVVP